MEKIRIVYVDDDSDNLLVFEQLFNGMFDVNSCNDPFEARKVVKEFKPHAVITDYRMPGKNGIALIHELFKSFPNLHFFLTTANLEFPEFDDPSIQVGYFEKPWNIEIIIDTLLNLKIYEQNYDRG